MAGDISASQMYELIITHLFLPESINFRGELEELYYTLTGEYIPSSFSLSKAIERIYRNDHQEILKKILITIAEKGKREFKRLQNDYPSLKVDIEKRIQSLDKFINRIKDC